MRFAANVVAILLSSSPLATNAFYTPQPYQFGSILQETPSDELQPESEAFGTFIDSTSNPDEEFLSKQSQPSENSVSQRRLTLPQPISVDVHMTHEVKRPPNPTTSPEFLSTKTIHNVEKKIKKVESSKRPPQDVSLELKPKMLQKSEKTLEIDVDIKPDVKISTNTSISKVQGTNAVDNLPQGAISRGYEFISKKPGMRTVTQNEKVRYNMPPSFIRKTTKVEDPPDMTTLKYEESLRKAESNSEKSLNDKSPPVDYTSTLSKEDTPKQNENRASINQGQKVVSRSIAAFQKRPGYENEAASTNNIVEKPVENHSLRMKFPRGEPTPAKTIQSHLPEMFPVVYARKAKPTSFPKRQVPEQTNKYVAKPAANYQNASPTTSNAVPPKPVSKTIAAFQRRDSQQVPDTTNQNMNRASIDQGQKVVSRSIAAFQKRPVYENEAASTNNIVEKPVENHSLRMEFARPKRTPAKAIQIDLPQMHNVVDARKAKPTSFPKRQVPEQTNKYVSKAVEINLQMEQTIPLPRPPKAIQIDFPEMHNTIDPREVQPTSFPKKIRPDPTSNQVPKPVEIKLQQKEQVKPLPMPPRAVNINLPEMHRCSNPRKAKSTSFPKRVKPDVTINQVSKPLEITLNMEQVKPLPRPPKAVEIRASMKNDISITPRKIYEAGDVSNNCYQVAKPAENHNLRMDFPQASRQPKAVRIDTPINHNVVRTTKSNQIELPDRNLSQSIPQRKNIVPKPAENHNVKVDHRVPRAVKPVHINLDRKK